MDNLKEIKLKNNIKLDDLEHKKKETEILMFQ